MNEYAEPHFNDEQTLLSARRVVPLEKIEAKARHRRQWFLGGAFAIAMVLGAASALVASYMKLRHAPQTQTATELAVEPEATPEPLPVAESAPTETPVMEPTEDEVTTPPEESEKEPAPKRRIVAAQHSREPVAEPDTRGMSEEEHLQQIRDAVLYDEWQERRARRVQRRERRRAERYNYRDLSNLDEIFEGRRRRSDRP